MCLRRIHFGQKKLSLASPVLRVDVWRHWEPCLQDLLWVPQGRLQEVLEVFLLGYVLVACFPPLGNRLTKINDSLEESIHEQYPIKIMGFPDSSVGKESSYNAGDPGSIPGSGRSPGEGISYPFQYS